MAEGKKETVRNLVGIVALIIVAWLAVSFLGADEWTGFYYPDANDLTENTQDGPFKTIDECRTWVDSQIATHNPTGEGYDYECGKNCKSEGDLFVCEETLE